MTDTLRVVQALLFRLLPGEPNADQIAASERIAAAYEAKHGPITKATDPAKMVRVIQTLTLQDAARQLAGAVR